MKKLIVLSLFLILGASVYAQNTTLKVAIVDADLILQQLPEAIKANGDLKALESKFKAELDSIGQAFGKEVEAFQKEFQNKPNDPKAKEKQIQLANKQKSIEDLQAKRREDLLVKQDELLKPIYEKLYDNIAITAKEEGMHYVLNKKSGQDPIVLYADVQFDLTYKVLDKIRKSGK
ncbi:MAG: OmpH family outer membrane protein [Ignavibacteria bacterium]|nr:OmpH family outer membrane protein [Ignavibacteria bacterium]